MNYSQQQPNTIIIIGGVALGAGVAAKARRVNEDARIIIIERGPYVSFANCGLPYYVGNVIQNRNALLLHTPESLKSRFNLDVRTQQEAVHIDREHKLVVIRDLVKGTEYTEPYDKLVLAMGATPVTPPLPGINLPGVFKVRDVPDADAIKDYMEKHHVARVAVIGAGFIGLELVENFSALGMNVTLIEKAPQILPPFDPEMTRPALEELNAHNVRTILSDGIRAFHGDSRATAVVTENGVIVEADLFILGLGVRPNIHLAKEAGLEVGETGALAVNDFLQTSDPDIYSGGDLAEVVQMVDGKHRWIPLAAAANKQSRVIGMNLFGHQERFPGALGTAIVRVGEITLALTGYTEKSAKAAGISYFVSYSTAGHHAGYYPGSTAMHIKLMLESSSGRVLGAQIVGREGVDKRIDVLATAITARMTAEQVAALDLAYAPPFSSAKDPVILAAMAADNIQKGIVRVVYNVGDLKGESVQVLDVRNPDELADGRIPSSINIPLDQLRERIGELSPDSTWVVYCRSGQRSYNACRILIGHGFQKVYNLNGGFLAQQLRGK